MYSPPPCGEELEVGVTAVLLRISGANTPTLPSPQGGGFSE